MVASSGRSLGVHLSKVRSLTLDSWEPEQLKVKVTQGGNDLETPEIPDQVKLSAAAVHSGKRCHQPDLRGAMSRGRTGQTQSRQQAVSPSPHLRTPEGRRPLTCGYSFRADKEWWIRQKYVDKRFVRNGGSDGESTPPPARPPQPRPLTPTLCFRSGPRCGTSSVSGCTGGGPGRHGSGAGPGSRGQPELQRGAGPDGANRRRCRSKTERQTGLPVAAV